MARSTRGIDYQDIPRPIAALSDEYAAGHHDPHHHHKRAQLIYACAGVTVVITEQESFVVPPQRAVWVPAGVEHEAHMRGHVSLRTLYVDPAAFPDLPTTCRVIEVSSLLRELIIEACRIPLEYDLEGRDGRVMNLLMAELLAMPTTPLDVPMPQDPRLVKVCTAILRSARRLGAHRRHGPAHFYPHIPPRNRRQLRHLAAECPADGGAIAARHRPACYHCRLRCRLQQPERLYCHVPPRFRPGADAIPRLDSRRQAGRATSLTATFSGSG
jgi:hypothetical protein